MPQFCVRSLITAQIEVKKSTFNAFLFPASDFSTQMALLRQEHPKARHFVYAYRMINELGQIVENMSDDGEPKGSSGKPSLTVLRGADFINTAVIIVRYFGGVKLGVGGLVRAYSDSINHVIAEARSTEQVFAFIPLSRVSWHIPFTFLPRVEHYLKGFHIENLKKEFDLTGVQLNFEVESAKAQEIDQYLLKNAWGTIDDV